ncbi:MAG: hypothetical protein ABR591_02015 [Candidatus Velthaea sp.]
MTDGLLEAHRDVIEGEAQFAAPFADTAFRVAGDPALLLRALAAVGDAHDDTARLRCASVRLAGWSFDARDRARAKQAHAAFVALRRAAGATEEQLIADEIVFGELVGNVARYTSGHRRHRRGRRRGRNVVGTAGPWTRLRVDGAAARTSL